MSVTRSVVVCCLLVTSVVPARVALAAKEKDLAADRNRMVDEEIVASGVRDPRVIQAMRDTRRHEFVPLPARGNAYYDMALPIGESQTISPPFIVAYMTEQLLPKPTDTVLEIGTGSGYQAAVLSPLVKDVYTIEIVKPLGERAARTLKRLKYANVHAKVGDGYQGWPEHAPFDKIIVTCSPEKVPPKLIEQLREGGRMVVPVGERYQQTLYLFEKKDGELKKISLLPVLFVPMTGKAEAGRVVQPDPTRPSIGNGDFEELAPKPPTSAESTEAVEPASVAADKEMSLVAWYYQRQLTVVEGKEAPSGSHYITFRNAEPGRGAQALEGVSIDGRKINELTVSVWIQGKDIRAGSNPDQLPIVALTFYDDNRTQCGHTFVGPWRDTFPWRKVVDKVHVPAKAREAIVRIGLGGATGELSMDDLRISASE
jgi:protein-L-isoaspartate(D-aspartate) O-methyltransferase